MVKPYTVNVVIRAMFAVFFCDKKHSQYSFLNQMMTSFFKSGYKIKYSQSRDTIQSHTIRLIR